MPPCLRRSNFWESPLKNRPGTPEYLSADLMNVPLHSITIAASFPRHLLPGQALHGLGPWTGERQVLSSRLDSGVVGDLL